MARKYFNFVVLIALAPLIVLFLVNMQTRIPEERPEKFYVELNESGGRMHHGKTIYLSPTESFMEWNYQDAEHSVSFTLTENELNQLWTTLFINKFDRITSNEEEVYDRGGITVRLSYGDTFFSQSNSGMSFIDGRWSDEFWDVVDVIENLAGSKIETEEKPFQIILDDALAADLQYLSIDENALFNHTNDTLSQTDGLYQFTVNLLEGEYYLSVETDAWQRVLFDTTGATGGRVTFTDGQLLLNTF